MAIHLAGDQPKEHTDENGNRYIVLEVHCLSCKKPVSPSEVDWDLFRNWGMPVHKSEPCLSDLAKVLTPKEG